MAELNPASNVVRIDGARAYDGSRRREDKPVAIAQAILAGFDKHYRLFREISAGAKQRFERAEWKAVQDAARERIQMYDKRVLEATDAVLEAFPEAGSDESLWPQIKLGYIGLLHEHKQPELAETFYNSVACKTLHRQYFHNQYIFWRPAVSTEHIEGEELAYRVYYPSRGGLRGVLERIVADFRLANPFENLERDLRSVVHALRALFKRPCETQSNLQIQVLASLFCRNKAAYIIGRIINGAEETPFAVPILHTETHALYLDALLTEREELMTLFSFYRAYFFADMEVPAAYVQFLRSLMPNKPKSEIYTMLGLQKQGKTLFFRDLIYHLKHSTDQFTIAPGIKGMVMIVFTLPSFPYVFKVIRDAFPPPKEMTREIVKQKYQLVKFHDRVGRLADTLEYSYVAFPINRFDNELINELRDLAPSNIEIEGDTLVIKHVYIERRMTPLNLYLDRANDEEMRHGIREYGNAIKDMAGANIFPGDMLSKNFGVTRHGRVVFYDYDEICYMTECDFKRIPVPRSWEDEMSAEVWYPVGEHDVFPEQWAPLMFSSGRAREIFLELHADLLDPKFWQAKQAQIKEGLQLDVFPYPDSKRFVAQRARG